MLGLYKLIHERVTGLRATMTVDSIAHVISNEYAIPYDDAKGFVVLCALADSMNLSLNS